jgi:hypothetical protein
MIRQFVQFAGGVPTKVVTFGTPLGDKPKKLILVIPGTVTYYRLNNVIMI